MSSTRFYYEFDSRTLTTINLNICESRNADKVYAVRCNEAACNSNRFEIGRASCRERE